MHALQMKNTMGIYNENATRQVTFHSLQTQRHIGWLSITNGGLKSKEEA